MRVSLPNPCQSWQITQCYPDSGLTHRASASKPFNSQCHPERPSTTPPGHNPPRGISCSQSWQHDVCTPHHTVIGVVTGHGSREALLRLHTREQDASPLCWYDSDLERRVWEHRTKAIEGFT